MAQITNNLEYQKALDYENFLTIAEEKIFCLYLNDYLTEVESDALRNKLKRINSEIYNKRHDYDKKRLKSFA